ncbi:methyl-accepting chemotaxis protein [Lentilitoribacter sp. EG35]|uniref:methyl-accepting chemotaxis protein n=1 Tax=Lentilitoribacter sp. EG35 TaxID=3234192 RepID=UPI0034602069
MKNTIANQMFIFGFIVVLAFIASLTTQYYALQKINAGAENEAILTLAIVLVAIMSILITTFVFYWIKKRAVAPLSRIGEHLAAGNFSSDVPFMEMQDEIGEIAKSIQKLKKIVIDRENKRALSEKQLKKKDEDSAESNEKSAHDKAERAHALQVLTHGLVSASQGDLSFRINEQLTPEFGQLRAAYNQSTSALSVALSEISNTTANVTNTVNVAGQSSTELAHHTEQHSTALEQTAAAINNVTTCVSGSSEQASNVQAMVSQTKEEAEKSGAVVRTAIEAMTKIEESAQQINQIIGVIDEIAFQTNLLALNAGVEAARAGEAGKGFAVVAQEVRELAGRSANAAKEIKGLIDTSSKQVETGVSLVNETGDSLQEIEARVAEINDIIGVIVQSSVEQSSALNDINGTMSEMNQTTKQSKNIAQQTHQSCSGLLELSSQLENSIRRFRLENSGNYPTQMPTANQYVQPTQPFQPIGQTQSRPVESLQLRAVDNTYVPSQPSTSPARSLGRRLAGAVTQENQQQGQYQSNDSNWDEF